VRKGEIVDFETAMKCVHEAVVDAEQKSDVMIRSVYVAVAGSHCKVSITVDASCCPRIAMKLMNGMSRT